MIERMHYYAAVIEPAVPKRIRGKELLIKNVVDFLLKQSVLPIEEFILCTATGIILTSQCKDDMRNLTGCQLNLKKMCTPENKWFSVEFCGGSGIVFYKQSNPTQLLNVLSMAETILQYVVKREIECEEMLKRFDYMDNAIMICDRECNIIFANTNFCSNFNVEDRDSILGMNVLEVMKQNGIRITSVETNSATLKMMDVIKNGKPTLDWSVRYESVRDPSFSRIVSNDMYPTFDRSGQVSGVVEISRSQHQEVKKARKYAGLNAEYTFDDVIGNSSIISSKIQLAKDFSGNRGTVLITGESGVGKEIFAQAIHNQSIRRNGPFVALNCANFPAELIESELFGYVEGAFTGASKKGQMGKFELANGGTLFLDEIGELPYYFQSKLLRVLETWTVTRIGGLREIPVDIRLIAATNRDLPKMIQAGLFRQDLYYRLQVLTLDLPPLRERAEDVPMIADHFLKIFAQQNGHPPKILSEEAKKRLMEYTWPGNARELKNVMNRTDLLHRGNVITEEALDFAISSKESFETLEISEYRQKFTAEERIEHRKKDIDKAYIDLLKEVLDITGGNRKKAATLLGISRNTFYRLLEKHGMK